VSEFVTYVALDRHIAAKTVEKLSFTNIKGRQFKMRLINSDVMRRVWCDGAV
jgi:ATP-independent RNA helicase DbpA